MLTLDEAKTAGECMVIQKRVEDVDVLAEGSYIGLCPQYNTLWDQLTVDESLNLVARMKGLNNADRDRNKQLILETLELTDFVDTAAKNLSGGNKRKLCCA
jgi:ABC-type multidrug transport system ATPase subunit